MTRRRMLHYRTFSFCNTATNTHTQNLLPLNSGATSVMELPLKTVLPEFIVYPNVLGRTKPGNQKQMTLNFFFILCCPFICVPFSHCIGFPLFLGKDSRSLSRPLGMAFSFIFFNVTLSFISSNVCLPLSVCCKSAV